MRCRACDEALTDKESVTKDPHGNYVELCKKCNYQNDGLSIITDDEGDYGEEEV